MTRVLLGDSSRSVGGGAGFILGPVQNSFGTTTGTLAAARTARDAYATANADWLADYDADDDLHIRLLSTAGATFEQRTNSAWIVVVGLVQGDPGTDGRDGSAGGGVNWPTPTSEATANLASATSSATAVDLGYDVTSTQDFFFAAQFESSGDDTEDTSAVVYVDASRLGTANSQQIPLGQNDDLHLRIDASNNLVGWRSGGDSGTYRIRIWEIGDLGSAVGDGVVTGGSINAAGTELTLVRSVGAAVVVSIPAILRMAGGGGTADGVVESGSINATGTELTLVRSVGGDVTVSIPAILRMAGGGSSSYYPIPDANVGGSANAITLTTGQSLTGYTGGMLFFFNSTALNTGAATINVDGIGARNLQRSRYRLSGSDVNTGSEPLEGGEITANDPIMVVYGARFNEFYLLPSRAGTAAYRNVGTAELDLAELGAGGVFANSLIPELSDLRGSVADSQIPAAIMRDSEFTGAAVRTLLGLTATEAMDVIVGAELSGTTLTFTQNDGTTIPISLPTAAGTTDGTFLFFMGAPDDATGADGDAGLDIMNGGFYKKASGTWGLQYTDMSGTPTPGDHNRYFALGADRVFQGTDFTSGTTFMTNVVTVPDFVVNRYFAFAVPDDEAITSITQLGIIPQDLTALFTQEADQPIGGTTHNIWVSNDVFFPVNSGIMIEVS